jgi:CBS domain containing-hemolysin-like protein
MRVTDLLLRMQVSRIHMALVIDEYGGTDGLVTIEDLIEEIVGEINDEHDDEETLVIAPLSGGGWEVDARVELEDFTEETGLHLDSDDDEIDTVGGFAVSLAGRVPQRGEVLIAPNGFDFEVTEGDARKVRKLRIRPSAARPAGKAAE